jgi:berberine-like enzyme
MVAIKSHYDPQNFFRLNQNVPPRRIAAEGCQIGVSPS